MSKKHPTEVSLNQYAEGPAGFFKRFWVSLHLNHCEDCRKKIEELQADARYLASVKKGVERLDGAEQAIQQSESLGNK